MIKETPVYLEKKWKLSLSGMENQPEWVPSDGLEHAKFIV